MTHNNTQNAPSSDPIKNTQHIYDLIALCAQKGVRHAVLCPGSRCAPLLIGFGKHKDIKVISVTDERSAGFIALGIAQQSRCPVVLVCTSGTAGQNFAPAVTEAFYQNTPLIILSADRPKEQIDQWDGQTIHQSTMYGDHLGAQLTYEEGKLDESTTIIDTAIWPVATPVHLNIPIKEPFYPHKLEDVIFPKIEITPAEQKESEIPKEQFKKLEELLTKATKPLIICGQATLDKKLHDLLKKTEIPVAGDVISNIHHIKDSIQSADIFFNAGNESLCPDLLITIGRSLISKSFKQYFKKHKPAHHWHIGKGMVGNPFQSITEIIAANPIEFFQSLPEIKQENISPWKEKFHQRCKNVRAHIKNINFNKSLNQFSATQILLEHLPKESVLHLGNSTPVRVANYLSLQEGAPEIWSNRGTSGIDGILSTAVGHALADQKRTHILIIGDLSFFYDRNGLWLNHEFPSNLKIAVINNKGGGIFKLIEGAKDQGEYRELFTTPHQRSIKLAAEEFNLGYLLADSLPALKQNIPSFLSERKSAIVEIITKEEDDIWLFKQLKQPINIEARK